MTKAETLFNTLGASMKGVELSQMFGKPALKINGKAFACFFQECMVFKLNGDVHANALKLKGAVLFDPSGKGRAMKEWVQVPAAHQTKWNELSEAALKYVQKGK